MTDWKADPTRGAEFVEPRRVEVLDWLRMAADIAMLALDEEEAAALAKIRQTAAQRRAKITKEVSDAAAMPPMRLVRKFWSADTSTFWQHFLGDHIKLGGGE